MGNSKTRTKLSAGRPPGSRATPSTLSSRATRTQIRAHHELHRALARAQTAGDAPTITALQAQLTKLGGLEAYQKASIAGQSKERGGDSSRVLIQWLEEELKSQVSAKEGESLKGGEANELKLLEVGALSTANACSRSKLFGGGIERIDLHSQQEGIKEQDFMLRPLPAVGSKGDAERFDVVSLSLVLNYVPEASGRGEMLRRVEEFLRPDSGIGLGGKGSERVLPALFLVLPAPCVTHSRYLTEERLAAIMQSLGYEEVKRKMSPKLVYYLWRKKYDKGKKGSPAEQTEYGKVQVNGGRDRNNFCVVLKAP